MDADLNPEVVRTPNDLVAFLTRLRKDIEREEQAVRERERTGEPYAALGASYASFTLPDALESLVGWLEDRFTDDQYHEVAATSDAADAAKWQEVARCLLMAAIYE